MWYSNNFPGKQNRMTLLTNTAHMLCNKDLFQWRSSPTCRNGVYHTKDYSSVDKESLTTKLKLPEQKQQSSKAEYFFLLQPSKIGGVMTFSHEIKCIRQLDTESKSCHLFFLFSVQEVTPKSNNFLFFFFIVGRKCYISRTERKHISKTKHKNRAYRKLQALCIHKAPSCTVSLSTGSPHWSIFASPSCKPIQPCLTANICACCDKTTEQSLSNSSHKVLPHFHQPICGFRDEWEEDTFTWIWFFCICCIFQLLVYM